MFPDYERSVEKNSALSDVLDKIRYPIKRDRFIYILALFICMVTYLIALLFQVPQTFDFIAYNRLVAYALVGSASLYCIGFYFYLLFQWHPTPTKQFILKFVAVVKNWPEIINFILLSQCLAVVLSCFTSLKTAIPAIVPYYLDPYFAQWDKWLFLGYEPWQLTHALFTSPWATATINFLYNFWFCIVWIFFAYSLCAIKKGRLRQKMIISNCLVWFINGGILAILFSSAGPVYAEKLFPFMHEYRDLIKVLTEQNEFLVQHDSFVTVWALTTQNSLWDAYSNNHFMIGAGISAFPSVHVSTTTLIALAMTAVNKKVGIAAWLYVVVIVTGSVHLGWHYAVDGMFGMLFTVIIWKLVGKWQQRFSDIDTYSSRL